MTIITGMHRSGTSLIAEILFRCGMDFGDMAGFYPADRWNPKGYFEQRDVIDLNSRLICGLPRSGGTLARELGQLIYLTMPGTKRLQQATAKHTGDLAQLGGKYSGRAVKDPRFCLTLRYWDPFVKIDSVVICMRGPRETALSLYRRQSIPPFLGFRFWNYHMENLLEAIPGRKLSLLDYDRLADPENFREELRIIRNILPSEISMDEIERRYRAVFEPDLRHFSPASKTKLPATTQRIWNSLLYLRSRQAF